MGNGLKYQSSIHKQLAIWSSRKILRISRNITPDCATPSERWIWRVDPNWGVSSPPTSPRKPDTHFFDPIFFVGQTTNFEQQFNAPSVGCEVHRVYTSCVPIFHPGCHLASRWESIESPSAWHVSRAASASSGPWYFDTHRHETVKKPLSPLSSFMVRTVNRFSTWTRFFFNKCMQYLRVFVGTFFWYGVLLRVPFCCETPTAFQMRNPMGYTQSMDPWEYAPHGTTFGLNLWYNKRSYMGVSWNGGTQQPWVFLLKMIILGCFGGTTI